MPEHSFHIYRSSAGSGKTRTLAREYILLAMRHPDYFKHILAVTFTNKSAQEMKDRVIRYLHQFKEGEGEDLAIEIRGALGLDAPKFKERSSEVLSSILHQYSQFSISTIDAFFQKVIRAFTRESGLLGNFRLEVENEIVLNEVIRELMDELGDKDHKQLTDWVIKFSIDNLRKGENWNLNKSLENFGKQVLKDDFKVIASDILRTQETTDIAQIWSVLQKKKAEFLGAMKIPALKAMDLLNKARLSIADFSYGDQGTAYKFFREFAAGRFADLGERILKSSTNSGAWAKKDAARSRDVMQLADQLLIPLLIEMIGFYKENIEAYQSIVQVEANFYSYGLTSDLTRKLKHYQAENNVMLLSDAAFFLNGIIGNSDTPFIYEKIGSFFRHYLIDEVQDTSELQWKNLRPLVHDGLDQFYRSLVVGDVKQSIYRWRGSDPGLLTEVIETEAGSDRTATHALQDNWRSAEKLVLFNNALFARAVQRVGEVTGDALPGLSYADLKQTFVKYPGEGFVRIRFFEDWFRGDEESGSKEALHEMPGILEELQDAGIPLSDVAILVRNNKEGQDLASYLLQYKDSPQAKSGFRYDVVSNESLRVDAASSIQLVLCALKFLDNPDDAVARGELVYAFCLRNGSFSSLEADNQFSRAGKRKLKELLPEEFIGKTHSLVKLSVFELVESLIRVFQLDQETKELAYLQSFQDIVMEFIAMGKNDVGSFLEWWEEVKDKRSITVAARIPAASIYTIHKAKGLQFRFVIVPFCSWEMKHRYPPLLWCRSEKSPFDKLGYVAVQHSSKLKETFFASDYEKENTRVHLDNLNLLYVAFTRAEEGLIVMAPRNVKATPDKISNVGQLVYESVLQSELRHELSTTGELFSMGTLKPLGDSQPDKFLSISLKSYPAVDWRKKLVIKREGTEFFQEETSDKRKRINYGILVHRILSHIHYNDQVEEALKKFHLEGIIVEDELGSLREKLNSIMNHVQAGAWFTRDWHVKTEVPVLIPGSSQDRLDRVIHKDIGKKTPSKHKAIIIDYKTGSRKGEDRKQVEQYALAMLQMGYVDVEGFLLYLDDLEVVPVVSKSSLTLF